MRWKRLKVCVWGGGKVGLPLETCVKKPCQEKNCEKPPFAAVGREALGKGGRNIQPVLIAEESLRGRKGGKGCTCCRNEVHSSVVNTKGSRVSPTRLPTAAGEGLSRDAHVFSLLLTSVVVVGGEAVSFAGLIGLMRFPYSSLRACQPARLPCHFPLLTADPLCKRRSERGGGEGEEKDPV